jgi:hypothetical protein
LNSDRADDGQHDGGQHFGLCENPRPFDRWVRASWESRETGKIKTMTLLLLFLAMVTAIILGFVVTRRFGLALGFLAACGVFVVFAALFYFVLRLAWRM